MAEILMRNTDDNAAEAEALEAELRRRALSGDEVAQLFLSKAGQWLIN